MEAIIKGLGVRSTSTVLQEQAEPVAVAEAVVLTEPVVHHRVLGHGAEQDFYQMLKELVMGLNQAPLLMEAMVVALVDVTAALNVVEDAL